MKPGFVSLRINMVLMENGTMPTNWIYIIFIKFRGREKPDEKNSDNFETKTNTTTYNRNTRTENKLK